MNRLCLLSLAIILRSHALGQVSAESQSGMICSASSIASQVGVDILKKGGNSVDAACAVGFALAVVYPEAGNLGGGGFMLVRLANGRSTTIDYRETAPESATRDMYLDSASKVIPNASLTGYRACGVPGTVAGLSMAHRKFGKLPWAQILEPAIRLAEGFPLTKALAFKLSHAENLSQFPESRRIFQRGGSYYVEGEVFAQSDLAETLKRIQVSGADDFYRGETARRICAGMEGNGLITMKDLNSYRAVERRPIRGKYRGFEILTMPPPSSGGIALIEMLNMLSQFPIQKYGIGSVETTHVMVESMRRAFADRSKFMGDPSFIKIPSKGLLSATYAKARAESIDLDHASRSESLGPGVPAGYESTETTHFSIVDHEGNAVSNTYTLNFGFGSGVTIAGTGFLLNDEMDDFTSKPGVPNGFGLIQGEANSIAPRKRPLSSMTPTMVTKDGKLRLVIGSPGGPTIITTVLQVISNVLDHGMNVGQAIASPRIHHQWLPDFIQAETGALNDRVLDSLTQKGHRFDPANKKPRVFWGDAEGISIDPISRHRFGASDPRSSDAAAIGYD